VGDLVAANRADLVCGKRYHGQGLAIQRNEFDFITLIRVDQHHRAEVVLDQTNFGKVHCQYNAIKFIEHYRTSLQPVGPFRSLNVRPLPIANVP
jgi:hypothetical protein